VFYVTAAVYTFGAVIYCFLASGSIQSWAIESAALHACENDVIEVELNGTDDLLEHDKHRTHIQNSETTADSLLQVDN